MMIARTLLLAFAIATLAVPASAVVKVYDSTPPHGTPGDALRFTTTLCPPVSVTPGIVHGFVKIDDTTSGTVTVTEYQQVPFTLTDFDATAVFGPGSFVFVTSENTLAPTVPFTAPGGTAPGATIDWGVIGGWVRTGQGFCISSPQTICTAGAQLPHGVTTAAPPINSPTYDLGTWSFDAVGDYEAAQPYINGTQNGGTTNGQTQLRGAFVGGGIPALPLIGVGALGLGLLVVGTRSVLRKR